MSALYPMAQLGLAQSLAKNGLRNEAHAAYQQVFETWKKADADFPLLSIAKREVEALNH